MKILPIDEVTPENIEEQIQLRQNKANGYYSDYLYGARNTWKEAKRQYDKMKQEIDQLEEMVAKI